MISGDSGATVANAGLLPKQRCGRHVVAGRAGMVRWTVSWCVSVAGIVPVAWAAASGWWMPVADGHGGLAPRGLFRLSKRRPKSRVQGWPLVTLRCLRQKDGLFCAPIFRVLMIRLFLTIVAGLAAAMVTVDGIHCEAAFSWLVTSNKCREPCAARGIFGC